MTVEQAARLAKWKLPPYTPTEEASVVLADEVGRLSEMLKHSGQIHTSDLDILNAANSHINSLSVDMERLWRELTLIQAELREEETPEKIYRQDRESAEADRLDGMTYQQWVDCALKAESEVRILRALLERRLGDKTHIHNICNNAGIPQGFLIERVRALAANNEVLRTRLDQTRAELDSLGKIRGGQNG